MWILLRDLARRRWALLSLGPLLVSAWVLVICLTELRGVPADPDSAGIPWIVFGLYFVLASRIENGIGSKVARVWRTLPLRHSSSAALAWAITALLPPLLLSAVILPLPCLFVWKGIAGMSSLSSVLLFLLFSALLSGLFAFISALGNLDPYAAAALRDRPILAFLLIANGGKLFLLTFIVAGTMLYHAPWYWSNLTPRHLVSMCLAAGMTWASYQIRYSLLQPAREKGDRRDQTTAPEKPPRRVPTYLTWFRNDLLRSMGKMFIWPPIAFCAGYALSMYISEAGREHIKGAALVTSLSCAMLVLSELGQLRRIKVYRTLPLSANRSILFLLAYPYALSLIAIPLAAALLWTAGIGQFHTPLLWISLIAISSMPFALFFQARFGSSEGIAAIVLILVAGMVVVLAISLAYDLDPSHFPIPNLWEGAAIGTTVALLGFYGLRSLIENYTMLYKRNLDKENEE